MSSLGGEDWVRLKRAMSSNGRTPAKTSEADLGTLTEHYTCFGLMNGSLLFSFASGTDVYGRSILHPYAAYYESSRGCENLPGRATSE